MGNTSKGHLSNAKPAGEVFTTIDRRGIVLGVEDLASIGEQWMEWLRMSGLNVVALHEML